MLLDTFIKYSLFWCTLRNTLHHYIIIIFFNIKTATALCNTYISRTRIIEVWWTHINTFNILWIYNFFILTRGTSRITFINSINRFLTYNIPVTTLFYTLICCLSKNDINSKYIIMWTCFWTLICISIIK